MAQPSVQLCLVLHNHQPIGNFDNVFEAAYQDSYLPFLDVFEPYEQLKISLHISGPLAVWLQERHPEYISRIADLVSAGRIEIVGGAFYEPILTMISARDRRGQITKYSQWLEQHLGGPIRGMWIPERVWESSLTSDIAASQIQYTVLDDYHFRRAGLKPDQLLGDYVVENEGQVIRVFPGSERLRYLIPFQEPAETVDYCRDMARQRPGCVLVFGDDGEKFGTWPDTKQHVYQNGWLKRFFDALTDNRDWLITSTLAEAVERTPPLGKIYLPDASYREMTEWALPVSGQKEYDHLVHEMQEDPRWAALQNYLAGGFWRNFKVKYPESDEMYSRMMYVSGLLQKAETDGVSQNVIDRARDHLYRGQCNCPYWHGAFGGIYLPHLRNAIYQHLITAECLLERAQHADSEWVEAYADDFNFDGRNEIRLANEKLVGWLAPKNGGHLYGLDLRELGHNLLATMQRRPEAYHDKVRAGQQAGHEEAASIHDRVVFKQEGLENCLIYDQRLRKSLVDHFWDDNVSLRDVADNTALERGDFADGRFDATVRRNPDRIQVMLKRSGNVWGVPLTITKGVTLQAGSSQLEIAYLLEGLPMDRSFHFAPEFNFSGMPADQQDRFFFDESHQPVGHLGSEQDLDEVREFGLTDQWLGLSCQLTFDQAAGLWTYPVQSVSQSESGFELVHQSVVIQPHWHVNGDRNGRWAVQMTLSFDTHSSDNQRSVEQMLALN